MADVPPPTAKRAPNKFARINPFLRRAVRPGAVVPAANPVLEPMCQNVDTVLAFYRREERKINRSQRSVELLSGFFGQPVFLGLILISVGAWVLANHVMANIQVSPMVDPPPYFWLQGIVSLLGLLSSTVVLSTQNRQGKSEAQRAHLDLQVNLLTEQKVTKIINLLEELRTDLPMVKDRNDAELPALRRPTDANAVLATIQHWNEADAMDFTANTGEVATIEATPTPILPHDRIEPKGL